MAMAISDNWLFQWDEIHSINGVFLVPKTGIWGHNCIFEQTHIGVSENSVPLNPMVNDHYPY